MTAVCSVWMHRVSIMKLQNQPGQSLDTDLIQHLWTARAHHSASVLWMRWSGQTKHGRSDNCPGLHGTAWCWCLCVELSQSWMSLCLMCSSVEAGVLGKVQMLRCLQHFGLILFLFWLLCYSPYTIHQQDMFCLLSTPEPQAVVILWNAGGGHTTSWHVVRLR